MFSHCHGEPEVPESHSVGRLRAAHRTINTWIIDEHFLSEMSACGGT